MARYGCTITVAAGKIPSSQSNFGWVATEANFPTAAIDGGAQSILNGGGNLRCYTDDTKATQIPVEVVAFVTGGTPVVQVWGLSPTLAVASTVYIEADTVATSQPIVTDTYGRNSVWSNDISRYHLGVGTGNAIDSAGAVDGVLAGVATTQAAAIAGYGNSTNLNDASWYTRSDPTIGATQFGSSVWINFDVILGVSNAIYGAWPADNTKMSVLWWTTAAGKVNCRIKNVSGTIFTALGVSVLSVSTDYKLSMSYDGSNLKTYINGVQDATVSMTGQIATATAPFTLFEYNSLINLSGKVQDLRLSGSKTANFELAEYNNQDDASTFWTTSAWTDQDGGGGTTGTITQTASSFTQSLAGTVVLPSTTGTITQTTGSFTQSLAGTVLSTAVTGTINQTASSFTQSLSGIVLTSITGTANQTTSSFTQSASGTMRVNITGSANQTTSAFNQSLLGTIAEPVLGTITQTTGSFTQSANGVVAEEIAGTITQTLSSFTMSASGKIPALWFDKAPAVTSWTDKV